uniref:Uncharacterized protein n=1 Tax=Palisada sp. TaxID=1955416 RepID=A0A1Z1MSN3_9FLOR|nr:hypothetical protein [Palisada sp.]
MDEDLDLMFYRKKSISLFDYGYRIFFVNYQRFQHLLIGDFALLLSHYYILIVIYVFYLFT